MQSSNTKLTPLSMSPLQDATQYQVIAYLTAPQMERSSQTSAVIGATTDASKETVMNACVCLFGGLKYKINMI